MLVLDQALNPECLEVRRGHGKNNMEGVHEEAFSEEFFAG